MSNKPVTMNRIRLIMQSLNQGESIMEISRKYGISRNTIKKYRNSLSLDLPTFSGFGLFITTSIPYYAGVITYSCQEAFWHEATLFDTILKSLFESSTTMVLLPI